MVQAWCGRGAGVVHDFWAWCKGGAGMVQAWCIMWCKRGAALVASIALCSVNAKTPQL